MPACIAALGWLVAAATLVGTAIGQDQVNDGVLPGATVNTGFGYVNNGQLTDTLFGASGVTTVINNGSIESATYGAAFFGPVGRFLNRGTIRAGQNGIYLILCDCDVALIENSGAIVATGSDAAIRTAGNGTTTILNSGVIRGPQAILFEDSFGGNGSNTLVLRTGSELYADTGSPHVTFGGGPLNRLDFSGFYGTAIIRVDGVQSLTAGDRAFVRQLDGNGDGAIVVYDQTGANSIGGTTSGTLTSIRSAIADQFGGFNAGNVGDANTLASYVAQPRQTSAVAALNAAVLSELDVADASRGAVWGTTFGGFGRDDAPVELSTLYGGLVAGSHHQLDAATRLGGLLGYSRSSFSVANGQQAIDSHTGVIGIYGRSDLGVVEFDYALLGGGSSHSSSRQVVVGAARENVTATFSSWFINPSVVVTIPVMSDDTTEINLAGSASYIHGGVSNYTERSANFTAVVGAVPISVFETRLELNGETVVGQTGHGDIGFNARGGVLAQVNAGSSSIPLSLNGTGTSFANPGTTSFGGYAGVGLSADAGPGLVLTSAVDLMLRDDGNRSAGGQIGLAGSF